MYHGQLLFRDHGQTPLPQHCQPWSNMVGNKKQWYHGHPDAGEGLAMLTMDLNWQMVR